MVWSRWFDLTPVEVANEVPTTCGVFCVARKSSTVPYTRGASTTVMLGVAADRQRGLRAVLGELAAAPRGGLERERGEDGGGRLRFCFQGNLGDGASRLHAALLEAFVRAHGEPPRCNPRTPA